MPERIVVIVDGPEAGSRVAGVAGLDDPRNDHVLLPRAYTAPKPDRSDILLTYRLTWLPWGDTVLAHYKGIADPEGWLAQAYDPITRYVAPMYGCTCCPCRCRQCRGDERGWST